MASNTAPLSLVDLSSQLSSTVERASQYVVAIRARRRIPSSGIIWRDGLIVSASHTVRRDGRVPVTLPSGDSVEATVIARDPETDLVVLRADGLPPLRHEPSRTRAPSGRWLSPSDAPDARRRPALAS